MTQILRNSMYGLPVIYRILVFCKFKSDFHFLLFYLLTWFAGFNCSFFHRTLVVYKDGLAQDFSNFLAFFLTDVQSKELCVDHNH